MYDLHTGGHNMRIQPSTMCFAMADAALTGHQEEVQAQLAMMAPLMMLRRQPPVSRGNGGMIWYDAKVQGKITIGTEWGGGGMSHPAEYDSILRGVENSLRQLGVLADGAPVATREGLGLAPTVISLHDGMLDYVAARDGPSSGLWAAAVEPGDRVASGGRLGEVYSLDKPHLPAAWVVAGRGMYVMGVKTNVPAVPGDALCWVGREISVDDLLANDF